MVPQRPRSPLGPRGPSSQHSRQRWWRVGVGAGRWMLIDLVSTGPSRRSMQGAELDDFQPAITQHSTAAPFSGVGRGEWGYRAVVGNDERTRYN